MATLVAGDLRGIVVILDGFGREVAARGGQIQVITDGSLPNMADFVGSCTRANSAAALVIAREWERGTMEAVLPPHRHG